MPDVAPIRIIHYNDVYNIEQAVREPVGGAARFVTAIQNEKKHHPGPTLVLFSGDAFSPAPLTPFTKGAEIPPILNATNVDVACIGNHELDNGIQVLKQRVAETNFPWIISNVWEKQTTVHAATGQLTSKRTSLAGLNSVHVLTRGGIKFGFMGLASWDWMSTLPQPTLESLEYTDFTSAARDTARKLRDDHQCDFVIALTHMRTPEDIKFTRSAIADLVLGGHDHVLHKELIGRTWLLKSGTDFKNYSTLDLYVTKEGKLRVSEPVHHFVTSDVPEHPGFARFVSERLKLLGPRWTKTVASSSTDLDGRFVSIRTRETALGNFVCDALASTLNANIALVNSGSFRSDSLHPSGRVTCGMIDTILPYKDRILLALYTGRELLERLEWSVAHYPHLAGAFCQVSGISFSFDPRRGKGNRILRESVLCRKSSGKMLPLDDNEEYTCALKTWCFFGNDGFPLSDESKILRRWDYSLPEILSDYLAQMGGSDVEANLVPEISPTEEERIRCLCPDEGLLKAYRQY